MDSQEPGLAVPAESEIAQIEQELEQELVQIEERIARSGVAAWLREAWSFATALLVTTAGVFLAGVVGILFCYAFFVTAPIALLVIAVVLGRSAWRHRALAT